MRPCLPLTPTRLGFGRKQFRFLHSVPRGKTIGILAAQESVLSPFHDEPADRRGVDVPTQSTYPTEPSGAKHDCAIKTHAPLCVWQAAVTDRIDRAVEIRMATRGLRRSERPPTIGSRIRTKENRPRYLVGALREGPC